MVAAATAVAAAAADVVATGIKPLRGWVQSIQPQAVRGEEPVSRFDPGKQYRGLFIVMNRTSKGPRAEHRQRERQRIEGSATLAETYPTLKSLMIQLEFMLTDSMGKPAQMKYKANLEHAKAVLLFACPNHECANGDFDLTSELAKAIAKKTKVIKGELSCKGQRPKPTKELVPCSSHLRYTLTLGYGRG